MPGIVEYHTVVQHALEDYGDLFASQPQRRHFAEYLAGLMLAERKTVLGIHRDFADIADQSCLNRFLTEVEWDVQALNERRLELLQQQSETRFTGPGGPAVRPTGRGVISIDNELIDHDGKRIADVGWFADGPQWPSASGDHAEQRHKIAHDDLIVNSVCSSGKHSPREFRRFLKRDQCEDRDQPFQNHTVLCRQLIDWVVQREIPARFAFDSDFTNAEILNHIHAHRDRYGDARAYVGDLKFNRKVESKGRALRVEELAAAIPSEHRQELRLGDERQWTYTCTAHIPGVHHKVRLLLIWNHRRDAQPKKILVTNRTTWETKRIVLAYRERCRVGCAAHGRRTGTETFHRDGKQLLGLGACQLRSGQACRAVLRESLRATLDWAIAQVTEHGETAEQVMVRLGIG